MARHDRQTPINVVGPEKVKQFQKAIEALESDKDVKARLQRRRSILDRSIA